MQNQKQMSNYNQKQTLQEQPKKVIEDSKKYIETVNAVQTQNAADAIDYHFTKCLARNDQNSDSSNVDSLNSTDNFTQNQNDILQSQEQRNKLNVELQQTYPRGFLQQPDLRIIQSDKTKKPKKQQQKQQNTLNEEIKNFEERITIYTQEYSQEQKYSPKIPEGWAKKFQIQKKRK